MTARVAATYFGFQAAAVVAWWVALALLPGMRGPFLLHDAPPVVLYAFGPPDLLVIAAGSAAASYSIHRTRRWAPAAAWFVTGAVVYGMVFTLAIAAAGGAGWMGFLLMAGATAGTVAATLHR